MAAVPLFSTPLPQQMPSWSRSTGSPTAADEDADDDGGDVSDTASVRLTRSDTRRSDGWAEAAPSHATAVEQQLGRTQRMYARLLSHNDDMEAELLRLRQRMERMRVQAAFSVRGELQKLRAEHRALRDNVVLVTESFHHNLRHLSHAVLRAVSQVVAEATSSPASRGGRDGGFTQRAEEIDTTDTLGVTRLFAEQWGGQQGPRRSPFHGAPLANSIPANWNVALHRHGRPSGGGGSGPVSVPPGLPKWPYDAREGDHADRVPAAATTTAAPAVGVAGGEAPLLQRRSGLRRRDPHPQRGSQTAVEAGAGSAGPGPAPNWAKAMPSPFHRQLEWNSALGQYVVREEGWSAVTQLTGSTQRTSSPGSRPRQPRQRSSPVRRPSRSPSPSPATVASTGSSSALQRAMVPRDAPPSDNSASFGEDKDEEDAGDEVTATATPSCSSRSSSGLSSMGRRDGRPNSSAQLRRSRVHAQGVPLHHDVGHPQPHGRRRGDAERDRLQPPSSSGEECDDADDDLLVSETTPSRSTPMWDAGRPRSHRSTSRDPSAPVGGHPLAVPADTPVPGMGTATLAMREAATQQRRAQRTRGVDVERVRHDSHVRLLKATHAEREETLRQQIGLLQRALEVNHKRHAEELQFFHGVPPVESRAAGGPHAAPVVGESSRVHSASTASHPEAPEAVAMSRIGTESLEWPPATRAAHCSSRRTTTAPRHTSVEAPSDVLASGSHRGADGRLHQNAKLTLEAVARTLLAARHTGSRVVATASETASATSDGVASRPSVRSTRLADGDGSGSRYHQYCGGTSAIVDHPSLRPTGDVATTKVTLPRSSDLLRPPVESNVSRVASGLWAQQEILRRKQSSRYTSH